MSLSESLVTEKTADPLYLRTSCQSFVAFAVCRTRSFCTRFDVQIARSRTSEIPDGIIVVVDRNPTSVTRGGDTSQVCEADRETTCVET